jgi:xylulokinase
VVREVVLCADLGSGSLRVGAVTAKGQVVATATAPMRAASSGHASGAVDPESWWRALSRTVGRTLDRLGKRDHPRGLCITGVTRAQVMLGRDGQPLGPALTFRDDRAGDDSSELARHFPTDNPADAITAFHPLARIAWLARTRPATLDRVSAIVEPKDFLNFRLTGRIAADSVTYSRYDALLSAARTLPERLERCVRLLDLPRIAPWEALGNLDNARSPWKRVAGIPVFSGSMDAWASAVGAGAICDGQAYDIAGTSEVAGLVTAARAHVPGLVSLLWSENAWQIGGPTQAGADCAAWCHRLFRARGSLAVATERAGALAPAANRPLFVPYLAGERAPLWRADLRGVFEGLALDSSSDDLLWSVLEGVAMQMQTILARAGDGSRTRLREVHLAGGGAQSNAWCAMKADVMNVPMIRTTQRETGLVGAAMAAAIGLGWHESLAAAAHAMCKVDRIFEPRPARVAIYAERIHRHALARQHAIDVADAARDAAARAHERKSSPRTGAAT